MPKIGQRTSPSSVDPKPLTPYWSTTDGQTVRIWHGDVLQTMRRMPSCSVQCVVTSPPYWGLRDYLTAKWIGGDPECKHQGGPMASARTGLRDMSKPRTGNDTLRDSFLPIKGPKCKCGAMKVEDHQLGSEPLHDCNGWATGRNCAEESWASACHVCRMVLVFREVRRVLRDDGTLWLNYGATYSAGSRTGHQPKQSMKGSPNDEAAHRVSGNLPSGNLCMVPARVALALQADRWILRQDIIWRKLSGMPESVRNRCSKSHEYVYLFVKKMGYFYDAEAIKTPMTPEQSEVCRRTVENAREKKRHEKLDAAGQQDVARIDRYADTTEAYAPTSSNKRSVWSADDETGLLVWLQQEYPDVLEHLLGVSSHKRSVWDVSNSGYAGCHFATFSPNLITPMILAGSSERGCCAKCRAPWKRVLERTGAVREDQFKIKTQKALAGIQEGHQLNGKDYEHAVLGTNKWQPTCECFGKFIRKPVVKTVTKVRKPTATKTLDVGGVTRTTAGLKQYSESVKLLKGKGRDHSIPSNRNGKSSTSLDPDVPVDDVQVETEELVYESDIPLNEHPVVPCVVFDPFLGSGTTAATAVDLGRYGCGIELSENYIRNNAIPRIEGVLMRRPSTVALTGKTAKISVLGKPRSK